MHIGAVKKCQHIVCCQETMYQQTVSWTVVFCYLNARQDILGYIMYNLSYLYLTMPCSFDETFSPAEGALRAVY